MADALLGGLGKKLKEKAKTAVTQKKNEAQAEAKQVVKQEAKQVALQATSNLEPYEQKMEDGSIVFKGDNWGMYSKAQKTDWKDVESRTNEPYEWIAGTDIVEKNALYYLYRWMKACEEGDTEKMVGEIYTRVGWCVTQIVNYHKNEKYGLQFVDAKQFVKDYNATTKVFKNIIWNGMPQNTMLPQDCKTQEELDNYAKTSLACWTWFEDKAIEAKSANKIVTQEFYLNQAVGSREVSLCVGYLKCNEAGFAEFENHLKNALKDTSSKFQSENNVLTAEECLVQQKAREEQWAKEEAEREAALLAKIEANTEDWPKSNMPELDAQILSIMKQKFPNRKIYRVSVMNNKWNVMMKGLVPERRVAQFWVEFDHKSGRRIAEEHYVCQYYNGNSYGKTQYQSQGTRTFCVRQK